MDMKAALQITAKTSGTPEVEKLRKSVGGLGETFTGTRKESKRFGAGLQNASLQIGDFAVQVGNGTAASVALAQQLPQLLGGFGVFGAVAGAAVAILVPLTSSLLGVGKQVKDAGQLADAASSQIDKLSSALKRASDDFSDVGIQAGSFSKELMRLNQIKAGVELVKSQSDLRDAIVGVGTAIKDQLGTFEAWSIASGNVNQALSGVSPALVSAEQGFNRVRGALVATTDRTREIAALTAGLQELGLSSNLAFTEARQLYDVMASGNVTQSIAAFEKLSSLLQTYGMTTDAAKKASLGLLETLNTLSGAAISYQRNLAAAVEAQMKRLSGPGSYGPSSASSGSTLPSETDLADAAAAAREKDRLRAMAESNLKQRNDELKRQNGLLSDYVVKENEAIKLLNLESQRVDMSAFAYQQLVEAKRHEYDVYQTTKDMLPEMAAKYEAVADAMFATRQEVEKLNYEQSRTFEYGAKQAFTQYAENAGNAADQIGGVIDDAFSGMEDALVEFVKTGKLDFSSLIDSMIADLARLALKQAILGPLAQALGSAISITPNAMGGVMTSNGPMPLRTYSAGGVARSPQLALYGEGKLPEAYVPLPDGRNIPVKMQGSSGGNVQVVVNNNSGQQVQTNESTDGRGNRRIEVQIGEVVASEIRRPGSSANMAIRNSFRATPALTGR